MFGTFCLVNSTAKKFTGVDANFYIEVQPLEFISRRTTLVWQD